MSSTLHFPSQETIKNYLETQHPNTKNDSYLKEKKVLEAAAKKFADKTFANRDNAPIGIQMGITLMLYDIGYKQTKIMTTIKCLSVALKDCAEGKSFVTSK